jgi:branched-subunit amino acid transport protein
MTIWYTIFGMVLVTFLIRFSVIALLRDADLPSNVKRALRFVPLAVLSAIIFPALFVSDGTFDPSFRNARLLAGIGAALVACASKRTVLPIVVGMILLWILQAALS